ncbi:MAG: sigma-70 family RNA polymerase sigma factor [Verrucomicrobia bacterium]|nr:MAG: sigma-70 family RNA polymerase sigma factor [Verrucomicrobiota bacterium]
MTPESLPGTFAPTRWTLVLQARGDTPQARAALGDLCAAYYQPVLRFLQREGRDEDAARELAQEFFARLLARDSLAGVDPVRGRFRSFLLGALRHFLADFRAHAAAAKRGGGTPHEPLPHGTDTSPGLEVAAPAGDPDALFDRQWALAIMDRSLARLSAEYADAGRGEQFAHLKAWLADGAPVGADAAERLGSSEGALRVAIHRMRRRFRELVRGEVAQTVPSFSVVDQELRYLVEVLAAGQS